MIPNMALNLVVMASAIYVLVIVVIAPIVVGLIPMIVVGMNITHNTTHHYL